MGCFGEILFHAAVVDNLVDEKFVCVGLDV